MLFQFLVISTCVLVDVSGYCKLAPSPLSGCECLTEEQRFCARGRKAVFLSR